MKIVIVGLGGIGSALCDNLGRYLNHATDLSSHVLLVDGDEYELKNKERQTFNQVGNKADVKCSELRLKFGNVEFTSVPNFINTSNIGDIISNDDIVFLCVDNHVTRQIVSVYCEGLKDVILISGGNEYLDGNVQLFQRKGGNNVTATLLDYHPEIENADDKSPEDMSCEELSKSAPQLLFTNLTAATIMCWMFYAIHKGKDLSKYGEVYFDLTSMATLAKVRNPKH